MTNEEKFKTPEERNEAFHRFCESIKVKECSACPLGKVPKLRCTFAWLALEAKEELLPCPFCGGDAEVVRPKSTDGVLVRCKECYSKSMRFGIKEEAIAAWNRRTK